MAAPSLALWRKTLGDSTFGLILSQLTPEDQNTVYQKFVASYTRKPDLIAASADAVMAFQTEQAAAQAKKKTPPEQSNTAPAGPAGATGATTAQDVQNQTAATPGLRGLFSGPNAAAPTSLFTSGGLDPTTRVPGNIGPPIQSSGESLLGLGGERSTDKKAGSYRTVVNQTVDQWLTGLYKMNPQELTALQFQLFNAGWYDPQAVPDPKKIPFGRVDPETIKAYESVMLETARYNQAGKNQTIDQTLAQRSPVANVPNALKSPSFEITNPQNVTAAYNAAAEATVGGGIQSGEAGFAQNFAGQEQAAYQRVAAAGADRAVGLGGAYVGRPDAGEAAKEYILAHNPQDVVNYDMALRTMQFEQALKEL